MHDKFSDAIATIVVGGLFIAGCVGLYLWTDWRWIAIGPVIAALAAIPSLLNSFGQDEIDTAHYEQQNG